METFQKVEKFLSPLLFFFYPPRVNGEDVRLMLWDTAGQEEFDAITKAYYRGKKSLMLLLRPTTEVRRV